METNQNVVCGANLPPIYRKRRRTVVKTAPTESLPHSLRDPYVQTLISEHTHTPSRSRQTTGQSHGGKPALPSPTISQRERRDMASSIRTDVVRASDIHGASPTIPGLAAPLPDASPFEHRDARRVSLSMLDKQHGRESLVAFGRPPGSHSAQIRKSAHDMLQPRANDPSDIHSSVGGNGVPPTHFTSPRLTSPAEPVDAYSPELSSRPAAPEGRSTRIEIAFEKLHQELLHSRDHESLIQEVAQRISNTSQWLGLFDAYQEAVKWARFSFRAGFRKNRFMDLMNLAVEEAPKCGPDVPYTHLLRYSRYHYDGSEWSPDKDCEEGSSKLESRDCKTLEGKMPERASVRLPGANTRIF